MGLKKFMLISGSPVKEVQLGSAMRRNGFIPGEKAKKSYQKRRGDPKTWEKSLARGWGPLELGGDQFRSVAES